MQTMLTATLALSGLRHVRPDPGQHDCGRILLVWSTVPDWSPCIAKHYKVTKWTEQYKVDQAKKVLQVDICKKHQPG